jgi:hypothetical protein
MEVKVKWIGQGVERAEHLQKRLQQKKLNVKL